MATNYAPVPGVIRVTGGYMEPWKLPLSVSPRQFPAGSPMWLNKVAGRYQAEPSLISTVNATANVSQATATADSGYATLALAGAPFAKLFLGFAAEGRVFQQLQTPGAASVPAPWTNYAQDASRPFITILPRGQAICPVGPTLGGVLATALEFGQMMQIDGFANDAGVVGFYDPAGRLLTSAGAGFFLHLNSITTAAAAGYAIGFVCERAHVGAKEIKIEFSTRYNFSTMLLSE